MSLNEISYERFGTLSVPQSTAAPTVILYLIIIGIQYKVMVRAPAKEHGKFNLGNQYLKL